MSAVALINNHFMTQITDLNEEHWLLQNFCDDLIYSRGWLYMPKHLYEQAIAEYSND